MLIYVAGPYRAYDEKTVDYNIAIARSAAIALWKKGHAVICPHTNSAHMDEAGISDEQFIAGDLVMVARCDAIVLLPNWQKSIGAIQEYEYAKSLGLEIFLPSHSVPDLHPTEVRYPLQVKAYAELLGRMYRLHLSKNEDYSPANILGTGEIGVAVRLYDKAARLLNLAGFRITLVQQPFNQPKISEDAVLATWIWSLVTKILKNLGFKAEGTAIFVGAKDAKHEAIEDTLIDNACYSIVALLLRAGVWGK